MDHYLETHSDLNIKYANCLVRHSKLGVILLGEFHTNDNNDQIKVKHIRRNGTIGSLNFNSNFNLSRIELGCRNYKNQAIYVGYSLLNNEDNSSCCYKQAIHPYLLKITDPLADYRYYKGVLPLTDFIGDVNFLKELFKNVVTQDDPYMIQKVLDNTRIGGAINTNYMVSRVLKYEEPVVYRRSRLIGTVNSNTGAVIIPESYKLFSDELMNLGIMVETTYEYEQYIETEV